MSDSGDNRYQRLLDCTDRLTEQVAQARGQLTVLQAITPIVLVEAVRHASDPVAQIKMLTRIMQDAIIEGLKDVPSSTETEVAKELVVRIMGQARGVLEEACASV